MISPIRNLAVAAATLVTGSIAAAGHAPNLLPPAAPSHSYSAPAYGGAPAACPPAGVEMHGTAVQHYAPAPAPAPAGRYVTGTTGQVYSGGRNAQASMSLFNGGYFFLGHSVGDGIGYNDGYTLFGGFVPLVDTAHGDGIWAAQGQYMILQDHGFEGDSAYSIGLMRRQAIGRGVLSAGAFYDWDSRFGDFDRVGFNIGYTGCKFSFNANYYNVVDDDAQQLSRHVGHTQFVANDGTARGNGTVPYTGGHPGGSGHPGYNVNRGGNHPGIGGFDNLAQDITSTQVAGLDGFDVNFGYLICPSKCDCCRGLRATTGFYGYNGHGIDSFFGWRAGLLYDANPNFVLAGQLNTDDQFGTTVNATGIWTPCRKTSTKLAKVCCGTDHCGRPITRTQCRTRSPFLYDLVQRQNRIAIADSTSTERVFLSDPKTGERYRVVSVGNGVSTTRDGAAPEGTSLNPYASLADVQAFSGQDDILYVQGGSDFDENLTLKTGQDVIGEGSTRVFHSVEHGDFTLGTVTGDTSRSVIGARSNIGNTGPGGGDAINVGEGHVIIDRVITRGDIDANTIADGRLEISDTIIDCGQLRVVDYNGGAMFDGSVTLTGVRVFQEAGSTEQALLIDAIDGDFIATRLDQEGLADFNDDWFTLNLAAPNDNYDGRNGFFSEDAAAASVTNVGGNIVIARSVFNSNGIQNGTHPANASNVTLSGTGVTGLHLANSDFSNQILTIDNNSGGLFLENALSQGNALPTNTLPALADAALIDALFSVGNVDVNAGAVEVLGNPIDTKFITTEPMLSVNPLFNGGTLK